MNQQGQCLTVFAMLVDVEASGILDRMLHAQTHKIVVLSKTFNQCPANTLLSGCSDHLLLGRAHGGPRQPSDNSYSAGRITGGCGDGGGRGVEAHRILRTSSSESYPRPTLTYLNLGVSMLLFVRFFCT